ncbi:glycosyltransferase family 4 protein [Gammaproteobacteria bacterium]|nr:glycosyltransferase family 4 protein [Gammaproteobacteria bacterium]
MGKKIFVIGVEPSSIINFRGNLIQDLIINKYEVIALARGATEAEIAEISKLGCKFLSYSVSRTGLNPLKDLSTFFRLAYLMVREKPTHVLAYTIKPVIWGGIASRLFSSIDFYALITGLGHSFSEEEGRTIGLRTIAIQLYRIAISGARGVIFQNIDNKNIFQKLKIIDEQTKTCVVKGSGIDTKYFNYRAKKVDAGPVNFLLIARMLRDKGIAEFIEAAVYVRSKRPNVKFTLVGPSDPSPNAFDIKAALARLDEGSGIHYAGAVSDVRNAISECDVFVLPSYHEGMPRAVLEAMAIGRPIITTEVAGCRETVENGKNGWLVPAKNPVAVADRMIWFLDNPNRVEIMGRESRERAISYFDVDGVNKSMISFIDKVYN